jgi:hypothetical protein
MHIDALFFFGCDQAREKSVKESDPRRTRKKEKVFQVIHLCVPRGIGSSACVPSVCLRYDFVAGSHRKIYGATA